MLLIHGRLLFGTRLRRYAARAIETRPVYHGSVVIDHGAIDIDVAHHASVYVGHSRVVAKRAARPHPASEADSAVTKAVVDPSVKSHVRSPIAGMPRIQAATIAPVARRP